MPICRNLNYLNPDWKVQLSSYNLESLEYMETSALSKNLKQITREKVESNLAL